MKITFDGIEVLSQEYRSWDDLVEEYIDYETEHGRQVPDYDLGVLLTAVGLYLLKKVADELIREARNWKVRSKEATKARIKNELEEKWHSELLNKIAELREAVQDEVKALPPSSTLTEEAAVASALLKWAKKDNVRIDIVLETEAEGDLTEAFEALTKDVPGSSVRD
jgi:hypothetical protein